MQLVENLRHLWELSQMGRSDSPLQLLFGGSNWPHVSHISRLTGISRVKMGIVSVMRGQNSLSIASWEGCFGGWLTRGRFEGCIFIKELSQDMYVELTYECEPW